MRKIEETTENEMKSLKVLLQMAMNGFGIESIQHFIDDGGQLVTAQDLIDEGWSKKSAEGTIASLVADMFIIDADHRGDGGCTCYYIADDYPEHLLAQGITTVGEI